MSEHRREARQRVFLKGRIMFNKGASSLDCLVRDLSPTGARLAMSETTTLPEVFDLYVPQKDKTYRATLRWRREDGVGVAFQEEEVVVPRAAPASASASAEPAGTGASVTMLLRRVGELEAENATLRRLLTSMAQPAASATAA